MAKFEVRETFIHAVVIPASSEDEARSIHNALPWPELVKFDCAFPYSLVKDNYSIRVDPPENGLCDVIQYLILSVVVEAKDENDALNIFDMIPVPEWSSPKVPYESFEVESLEASVHELIPFMVDALIDTRAIICDNVESDEYFDLDAPDVWIKNLSVYAINANDAERRVRDEILGAFSTLNRIVVRDN